MNRPLTHLVPLHLQFAERTYLRHALLLLVCQNLLHLFRSVVQDRANQDRLLLWVTRFLSRQRRAVQSCANQYADELGLRDISNAASREVHGGPWEIRFANALD